MLSREEQQQLLDIEQWFYATEPDLARALSKEPRAQHTRRLLMAVLVGVLLIGLAVVLLS